MKLIYKLMDPCTKRLKKMWYGEPKRDIEQPAELKEIVIDKGEHPGSKASDVPPSLHRSNSFFNPPVLTNDLREKLAQAGDKEVYNIALNGKIW